MKKLIAILLAFVMIIAAVQPALSAKESSVDPQEKKIIDAIIKDIETIDDKVHPVYMKFLNVKYLKVDAKTLRFRTTLVRFRENDGLVVYDCSYIVFLEVKGNKKTLIHYSIEDDDYNPKVAKHPLSLPRETLVQIEKDLRKIYKPHIVDRAMNFNTPEGYTAYKKINLSFVANPAGTFADPKQYGPKTGIKTKLMTERYSADLDFAFLDYIIGPEAELVRDETETEYRDETNIPILVKVRFNIKNIKLANPKKRISFWELSNNIGYAYNNSLGCGANMDMTYTGGSSPDPMVMKKYPMLYDLVPQYEANGDSKEYGNGESIMTEGWILLMIPKHADNLRLTINVNTKLFNGKMIYYEFEKKK